jgi:glutaredoxin 3
MRGKKLTSPWRKVDSPYMASVKMYTTAVCPYCIRAKQILKARGVDQINEIRVDAPAAGAHEDDGDHGRRTVPQIFIGDTHVGGCDDPDGAGQPGRPGASAPKRLR